MHFSQTSEYAYQKIKSTGISLALVILRIQNLKEIYKICKSFVKLNTKKFH